MTTEQIGHDVRH